MVRNTTEASNDEYDYVVVTMKSLPDVFDVNEIIRPGMHARGKLIVMEILPGS